MSRPKAKPGQHLLQEFRRAVATSPATIRLKWISGHSEVRDIERADKLAKEAAEGRGSVRGDLPALFRSKLPVSVSACKKAYLGQLKARWLEEWADSPRKRRLDPIDAGFPFNSFRGRAEKLSRRHHSLMVQVRSGHLPLNFYLHRIGKTGSRHCLTCAEGPEGIELLESICHFLYDCEAFSVQRGRMVREIGSRNIAVRDIMKLEKRMSALAVFIITTKRLSNAG